MQSALEMINGVPGVLGAFVAGAGEVQAAALPVFLNSDSLTQVAEPMLKALAAARDLSLDVRGITLSFGDTRVLVSAFPNAALMFVVCQDAANLEQVSERIASLQAAAPPPGEPGKAGAALIESDIGWFFGGGGGGRGDSSGPGRGEASPVRPITSFGPYPDGPGGSTGGSGGSSPPAENPAGAAAREAASREAVVKETAAREATFREEAAREVAARESARDTAARDTATREAAVRQAALETAARDLAARDAAAREKGAREGAARTAPEGVANPGSGSSSPAGSPLTGLSGPAAPAPLPPPGPPTLTPELRTRIQLELARHVGPVASLLVNEIARPGMTVSAVVDLLAREIDMDDDRAAFLSAVGSLAR